VKHIFDTFERDLKDSFEREPWASSL